MRCTQATLEALGVYGKCPIYGTGVIQALQESGKQIKFIYDHPKTLRTFARQYPKGKFYLTTSGHAIALVDGVITDTQQRGVDCRRVLAAVQVFN